MVAVVIHLFLQLFTLAHSLNSLSQRSETGIVWWLQMKPTLMRCCLLPAALSLQEKWKALAVSPQVLRWLASDPTEQEARVL